jgi:hypothetical protein
MATNATMRTEATEVTEATIVTMATNATMRTEVTEATIVTMATNATMRTDATEHMPDATEKYQPRVSEGNVAVGGTETSRTKSAFLPMLLGEIDRACCVNVAQKGGHIETTHHIPQLAHVATGNNSSMESLSKW